jgi:sugar-specific transcriptional regulator TrmB
MIIFDNDPDSISYEHKQAIDDLLVQFSKFGFSPNQSKVYIYLGKYGSKTAPEVCRALRIPRTETYQLLATLQNRGVVSATFQHPIKFSALSLERTIKSMVDIEKDRIINLETKKDEISKIWYSIPTFHNEPDVPKDDKFQILQGRNQIFGKIKNMIINAKNEFLLTGNEQELLKFHHANFLEPLDKSDIKLKVLTNSSERTLYVFDDMDRKKVKKIPSSANNPYCFVIKDSEEIIIFMKNSKSDNNITALWTNSEAMIYSNKLLFNLLWSKSKSIPM